MLVLATFERVEACVSGDLVEPSAKRSALVGGASTRIIMRLLSMSLTLSSDTSARRMPVP
jgi:hypothetical protein